jgi:hypothetical protein
MPITEYQDRAAADETWCPEGKNTVCDPPTHRKLQARGTYFWPSVVTVDAWDVSLGGNSTDEPHLVGREARNLDAIRRVLAQGTLKPHGVLDHRPGDERKEPQIPHIG